MLPIKIKHEMGDKQGSFAAFFVNYITFPNKNIKKKINPFSSNQDQIITEKKHNTLQLPLNNSH